MRALHKRAQAFEDAERPYETFWLVWVDDLVYMTLVEELD